MPGAITRRRTGCVVCRNRHIRCDEAKPSCQNCIRNSQACSWMRNLRFIHETKSGVGRTEDSTNSKTLAPGAGVRRTSSSQDSRLSEEVPPFPTLAHEEPKIPTLSVHASTHDGSISSESSNFATTSGTDVPLSQSQSASSVLTTEATEVSSDYASLLHSSATLICRSESAKLKDSIDNEHASPIPPNLNANPEGFTDWDNLGISEELQGALNSHVELSLLQNYIWECSPWFDAPNSKRNYPKTDVPRMMNCPPWRAAALALSAKNLELLKGTEADSHSLSLHLYQLAVRLAIDSISGRFDCVGTLAGCVLLAVYEMMTVSYTDWRRHLQGCANIFIHNCWNGSTGGLISASFWNYARIDTWAAFCSSTDTLIDPNIWFDKPQEIMSLTDVDEDTHVRISTWLLGRTVNLVCRNPKSQSARATFEELENLRADLSKWEEMGSRTCRAVISQAASPSEDIPFPRILFSSHSSVTGHIMFHTAMVLLLEFEQSRSPSMALETSEAIYHHSRASCGMIETNNHTACLVGSLQPIYISGRHLRTRAEKFAALELLAQIEKRTGWKCDWRARGLRELWKLC